MSAPYFDPDRGLLAAQVFSDPAIYRREQDSLFRRSWLFLGPAAWLEQDGDFVSTSLGDEPVLVWRRRGTLHLLADRCLGSDQPLAPARRGHAASLRCRCHGWDYGAEADAALLSPDSAGRVAAWSGLLFGCQSDTSPTLEDAMAGFSLYFHAIARSLPGGIRVIGEAPLVTRLPANWKLGAEAWSGDLYRDLTLGAATRDALGEPSATGNEGFQVAAGAGAAIFVERDAAAGDAPAPLAHMLPLSATVWPNLSFDGRTPALLLWQPRGASETEVHAYCLGGASDAPDTTAARIRAFQLRFGPAGFDIEDHAAVWTAITERSQGQFARTLALNLQMGLGRERRSNLPGVVADLVSESNQRAFYAWWQDALRSAEPRKPRLHQLRPVRPIQKTGD